MIIFHNANLLDLNVLTAVTFLERAGGLLFRPKINMNEVLYLKPCNSVHTLGMKYSIDVVYLNRAGIIIKVIDGMKPYRASYCTSSKTVLEFISGVAKKMNLRVGDQLLIK